MMTGSGGDSSLLIGSKLFRQVVCQIDLQRAWFAWIEVRRDRSHLCLLAQINCGRLGFDGFFAFFTFTNLDVFLGDI